MSMDILVPQILPFVLKKVLFEIGDDCESETLTVLSLKVFTTRLSRLYYKTVKSFLGYRLSEGILYGRNTASSFGKIEFEYRSELNEYETFAISVSLDSAASNAKKKLLIKKLFTF